MAQKKSDRPSGDMDDLDFPQPPDGMDDFPLPPGHGDDGNFEAMPVPSARKAGPGGVPVKGRAPVVETFPDGDDEEEAHHRPVRRRSEPDPDENYSFDDDQEVHGGAFADTPEHHDDGEGGFGHRVDDDEGAFEAEHDPDHPVGEAEVEPAADAPAAKAGADRSKLFTYGAAGALVLFTSFFGWKYVSSVFGLDAAPPAQVSNLSPMGGMPQPKWGNANAGNPGMAMPQGIGGQQAVATAQRTPPGLPQSAALPAAPGMPQNVSMKGPATMAVPASAGGPGAMQAAPPLPGLSEASPMASSSMPPAGMMGGQPRDSRPAASADPAVMDRIDRLERRLAELSDRPAAAPDGDRLASLEQRLQGVEARAVAPTTPRPSIMPPTKPQVIQGWSLKGVQNGVAWLNGPSGFVEARVGTDLPGAGHVKSVARYDQDWVVMTDNGVILRK